jgi:hypothetical protein
LAAISGGHKKSNGRAIGLSVEEMLEPNTIRINDRDHPIQGFLTLDKSDLNKHMFDNDTDNEEEMQMRQEAELAMMSNTLAKTHTWDTMEKEHLLAPFNIKTHDLNLLALQLSDLGELMIMMLMVLLRILGMQSSLPFVVLYS